MSNTMNINYMTRAYGNLLRSCETNNDQKTSVSFLDKVAEINAENTCAARTANVRTVSAKDMTMEEYKQYIHDKISQIPMHPSRMSESISINISEAGFESMKNDSEYEAWVMNDLRTGWAQPDMWAGVCGGAYSTIYYGATKEECHAEMWNAGYQNGKGRSLYNEKSQDSFWERRAERKKLYDKQYEEAMESKALQEQIFAKLKLSTAMLKL